MPHRIPTPGISTPAVRKSTAGQKAVTGDKAIAAFQKTISPSGMKASAKSNANTMKALHPDMYKKVNGK
jgi:hypothetical protein